MRLFTAGGARPPSRTDGPPAGSPAGRPPVGSGARRWLTRATRPAVGPLALILLATLALVAVTGSGPQESPPRAVASQTGGPDAPRLAFTSDSITILGYRRHSEGSYVSRLFGGSHHDTQASASGRRLTWVRYGPDQATPDPGPSGSPGPGAGGSPGPSLRVATVEHTLEGDIYVLHDGVRNGLQRTRDGYPDAEPALSPTSPTIAYSSFRDGTWDLYTVDENGPPGSPAPRLLTGGPGDQRHPSWSSDGRQVVFTSDHQDPAGDLYVYDTVAGTTRRLTDDPASDSEPVFSRDGSRIAFVTSRFGRPDHVAVLPATGGVAVDLGPGRSPAWSPDGDAIALVRTDVDPLGDIWTVSAAGGAATPHSDEAGRSEEHPTYRWFVNADGGPGSEILIAFGEWEPEHASSADIRGIDLDRADPGVILAGPGVVERNPSYSPDGRRLAYEESHPSAGPTAPAALSRIAVADADGSGRRRLPVRRNGDDYADPAFSPDGRFIAARRQPADTVAAAEIVVLDAETGAEVDVLECTPWPTPVPKPLWRFTGIGDPDGEPADSPYLTERQCYDNHPAWSRDGRTIAFGRNRRMSDDWFVGRIFTVPVGRDGRFGGTVTQVTPPTDHNERSEIRADRSPAWSPDGPLLAYSRWVDRFPDEGDGGGDGGDDGPGARSRGRVPQAFSALATIRPDGTAHRTVLDSRTPDTDLTSFDQPVFTPDAAGLVFSAMPKPGDGDGDWQSAQASGATRGRLDIHALTLARPADVRVIYAQVGDDSHPTFQPRADLVAKLVPDPPGILLGQRSVVTLNLTDAGHHHATGVVADLTVAAGLTVATVRFRQPPGPAAPIVGSCTTAPLRCRFDEVPRGVTVPVDIEVVGATPGAHEVGATVRAREVDPDPSDNTARTAVAVDTADIAVSVTAAPVPAYVGGDAIAVRYVVDNEGTGTTGPVRFTATLPSALPVRSVAVSAAGGPVPVCVGPTVGCDLGPFSPSRVVTILVLLGPDVPAASAAVGTVQAGPTGGGPTGGDPTDDTARVDIEVRGPTLAVTPGTGKPGSVPFVFGAGFPPDAKVLLRWDRGITSRTASVQADAAGAFRVPMIVFHRDVRGPRIMTATRAAGEPAPGAAFGPVRAPQYLVVPPSDQPDDWRYRR